MAAAADLVIRVVTDTSKAASGLSSTESGVSKFSAGVKKAAVPAAAALAAVAAAAISAGNAAADDAQAAAVLANGLKNSTGATDKQIAATESYIDKMAKATGIADDQLRPAMAALARGSGDVTTAQKDLAIAMDTSVTTGKDMQSISEAIAKAYGGNTASLKKLVPTLDAATLASGDMKAIMGELADQTGGAAAAAADTTAGKMQVMKVRMQEAQEEIGGALLPVMSKFAEILGTVAAAAQAHPGVFIAIASAIAVLAVAILAVNVALSIMAIAEVVALGPILLIVAAVIALIVVVVLIVKHFDTLKAAGMAAWEAIQSGAGQMANFVTNSWNKIRAAVSSVFGWIRSNWPTILAILTGPIGLAVLAIAKNWDTIKAGVGNMVDRITGIVAGLGAILAKPFNIAKGAVEDVSGAVSTVIGWIKKVVPPVAFAGPFDTAKTAINSVITAVQSLISWLGKIKVPNIHLPHIPGTGRSAAPAVATAGRVAAPTVAGVSRGGTTSTSGAVVINVTGALDPEAVARQIRRILAGHDRRVGLAT